MRLKYIILPVFLIICLLAGYGKNKAIITLHLNNLPKDSSSNLFISMGDTTYYVDTVGLQEAIIKLDVDNPFPVMMLANNVLPSNKVFWVHEGAYEVYYDMKTYEIGFKKSSLNNEFVRTRSIRDSINYLGKEYEILLWQNMDGTYRKKDSAAKVRLEEAYAFYKDNEKEIALLDSLAIEELYQYYTTHPTSFLALDFVNNNFNCAAIQKERLQDLFAKLNTKLKKYPMYATCRKSLMNPDFVPPSIPEE